MGNRRLGRKRLYGIEKEGQEIDLGAGAGISPAIARTTQHRLGQELITEIVVDLGSSAATGTILGGGGAEQIIGIAAKTAHLGQLTVAKVGVVTEIRAVMTEVPAGGAVNVDLWALASGTAVRGAAGGGGTAGPADMSAIGEDTSTTNDANGYADLYLYLTNATGDSGGSAQTAGKLTIYIYGFAVPDDL